MTRQRRATRLLLVGAIALAFGITAPEDSAYAKNGKQGKHHKAKSQKPALPFEEASVFFELNHTDGDLGIHALIDGDAWRSLEIEDPNERKMLDIDARGRLRDHGLTEVFFESAEPSFLELPPEAFFARFPAGDYEVEARTLEGEELESTAEVSHVMPAPPENITLSGVPAAENCDADPLPSVGAPVVVDWDDVEDSHPSVGDPGEIEVAKYTLVLEREEPELLIFSVELPAGVTSFEVPEDFTDLGEEFKLEIQVKADNGNQTVVETCFELE